MKKELETTTTKAGNCIKKAKRKKIVPGMKFIGLYLKKKVMGKELHETLYEGEKAVGS